MSIGIQGIRRTARAALCGAALLVASLWALGGCAGGGAQQLPEFPHYAPADDFLAMQERLRAYRPPPPPDAYAYTEQNAAIYEGLRERQRISDAEVEYRSQQQEAFMRQHRLDNLREWGAMRERLARDEALQAMRQQEISHDSEQLYRQRYDTYRNRLERLAQQQEYVAREREKASVRNQQRVEQQLAELKQRQSQNLKVQGLTATGETPPGTPAAP